MKYFRILFVADWIGKGSYSAKNSSIIWNGFIRVLGWISKSLCWKVGRGSAVVIGVDPMIGMEYTFTLSGLVIIYLCDYGITMLDQVCIP